MHYVRRYALTLGIVLSALLAYTLWLTLSLPSQFPVGKPFLVDENESFRSVSVRLKEEHYIHSALWFRALVSLSNRDRRIQVGYYLFNQPTTLTGIVGKFVVGKPDMPIAQITIPEGSTDGEIAKIVHDEIPGIGEADMIRAIHDRSAYGFLFPETYYLTNSITAPILVERMVNTFIERYKAAFKVTITERDLAENTTLRKEVSLAAILEGEAKTETDMKLVSGILQKRLELGMPLQVDVAKETYTQKGLPEPAVANPGIVALRAAREPTASPYLYYISGKDGTMHYAKTFGEHKQNITKYLR